MDAAHTRNHGALDIFLYVYELFYTVIYFTFIIIAVWEPAVGNLFLMEQNKTLVSVSMLGILCIYVFKTIKEKKLYTVGPSFVITVTQQQYEKQQAALQQAAEAQQRAPSFNQFASYISFITGTGAGFASSLQGKFSIFYGGHAIIGILQTVVAQNVLIKITILLRNQKQRLCMSSSGSKTEHRNQWVQSFAEIETAVNAIANILSIFRASLLTNWVLNYLASKDFDTYPIFYAFVPLYIYLFLFHVINTATSSRITTEYVPTMDIKRGL